MATHSGLQLMPRIRGRDNYRGVHPLSVANPRKPAVLLHHRQVDGVVLASIDDAGTFRLLRLETIDHPELARLQDRDRATLQAAVMALHRGRGVKC